MSFCLPKGYDDAGRLAWLADQVGNKTEWRYDDAGRMTKEIDPLGHETVYTPDENGNVVSVVDRLGRERVLTYDKLNRVTSELWFDAVDGAVVDGREFRYDDAGNLKYAANAAGAYELTHDELNRVETVAGPQGVTLSFGYDAGGNRTKVTDNKGGVTESGYDGLGRLTSRELSVGGAPTLKAVWGYDPSDGDLETFSRYAHDGAAWKLAGETTYAFDDLGRVSTMHLRDGAGGTVSLDEYLYDALDRVTFQRVNGAERGFSYYDDGQLKADGGTGFTYDKAGNRTTAGYATDPANRLKAGEGWTFAYDDAGQVVGRSKAGEFWTYQYDHAGRMTSASRSDTAGGPAVTEVEYTYDVFGNRVQRTATEGGVTDVDRFAYDGWDTGRGAAKGGENFDAYLDLDGAGAVTMRRVFGGGFDAPVGRVEADGDVAFYGADRLGSVRNLFDETGAVLGRADYAAFGARSVLAGVLDRYSFTGREWDEAVELQYSRARVYDPATGRFFGEDSLRFAAGDPNLHRYVGNNATNRTDPSGLQEAAPSVRPITEEEVQRIREEIRLHGLQPPDSSGDPPVVILVPRAGPDALRQAGLRVPTPADIEHRAKDPFTQFFDEAIRSLQTSRLGLSPRQTEPMPPRELSPPSLDTGSDYIDGFGEQLLGQIVGSAVELSENPIALSPVWQTVELVDDLSHGRPPRGAVALKSWFDHLEAERQTRPWKATGREDAVVLQLLIIRRSPGRLPTAELPAPRALAPKPTGGPGVLVGGGPIRYVATDGSEFLHKPELIAHEKALRQGPLLALPPAPGTAPGAGAGALDGTRAGALAKQKWSIPTKVDEFDLLAVESPAQLEAFLERVRAQGWIVKPTTKIIDEHAYFLPRKNRFYYDPERFTVVDLMHEDLHLTQFARPGGRRFNTVTNIQNEIEAYRFELELGRRHGFDQRYMNYLEGRIEYYEDLLGRINRGELPTR